MFSETDKLYMYLALSEAQKYIGATSPNPPVGACLVKNEKILGIGAHPIAGAAHAEIIAIDRAQQHFGKDSIKGSTLYVTLEPCNHTGKTPPCTQAIIAAGISKVIFGVPDPNAKVTGGGSNFLTSSGIQVESGLCLNECAELIAPFKKWIQSGIPWIVHKIAYRVTKNGNLTMVPEKGASTFTTPSSLREAHLERRKSDAIITGMGTVLTDSPKFNVRHIQDHENRRRVLVVLSKEGQEPPQPWLEQEWNLGFEVLVFKDLNESLKILGELGIQRALVEAGPKLSKTIIEQKIWDERLIFVQNYSETFNDKIPMDLFKREFRESLI